MSEAELLQQLIDTREQFDLMLAQMLTLNVAIIVGVYYFLHRAGLILKAGVFVLYLLGWFLIVGSMSVSTRHSGGLYAELRKLRDGGEPISQASLNLLEMLESPLATAYFAAANTAIYLLLAGAFGFLFFWKRPSEVQRS